MNVKVGDLAPEFTLRDQNNQKIALKDFRGEKNVLLVFYPLAFTGVCQGELAQAQGNLTVYQNADVQILTISVDSPYSHKVWATQQGYEFPLLADFWPHGAVARTYGVFDEEKGFANRGTFIIDTTGVIRYAEMTQPGEPREQNGWKKVLETLV